MKLLSLISVFLILPFLRFDQCQAATQAAKTKVALIVITEQPETKIKFESALKAEFGNHSDVQLTNKTLEDYVLWVYAAQSINNKLNPRGYSVAIAHTVPDMVAALANTQKKICKGGASDAVSQDRFDHILELLLARNQPLMHLNVANLESSDPDHIAAFAKRIVGDFVKRVQPR